MLEEFMNIYNERLLNDEFLTDEYFNEVSSGRMTDEKVNPAEDYLIVRGFMALSSLSSIARLLNRTEKCVALRVRILNLHRLHLIDMKDKAHVFNVLLERLRAKALLYLSFCKQRKWVWELVSNLEESFDSA